MNWQLLILALVIAWILQAGLTMFQIRNYQRRLRELGAMARGGYLGIGTTAGRVRAGSVVMLVANAHGKIIHAERMRGRTVFARFQELPQLQGLIVRELLSDGFSLEELDEATAKATKQAAGLIDKKMHPSTEEEGVEGGEDPEGADKVDPIPRTETERGGPAGD